MNIKIGCWSWLWNFPDENYAAVPVSWWYGTGLYSLNPFSVSIGWVKVLDVNRTEQAFRKLMTISTSCEAFNHTCPLLHSWSADSHHQLLQTTSPTTFHSRNSELLLRDGELLLHCFLVLNSNNSNQNWFKITKADRFCTIPWSISNNANSVQCKLINYNHKYKHNVHDLVQHIMNICT